MAEAKKPAKAASETFTAASEQMKSASEAFKSAVFPQFDMPRVEFPAAYRDLAEQGLAQAKQNYERVKSAAEETTALMESTYACAARGFTDYNMKILEAMRANMNANFDFASSLFGVKSPSEAVELSSAHARKTFETVSAQGKELASLAQKVQTETSEPIKAGFNKALRLVA